ncbi:hypothetical protein IKD56_03610 [bacterium]|nr:hypothetical protein [bacterium]
MPIADKNGLVKKYETKNEILPITNAGISANGKNDAARLFFDPPFANTIANVDLLILIIERINKQIKIVDNNIIIPATNKPRVVTRY